MAQMQGKKNDGLKLDTKQVNELSMLLGGTLFKDGQDLVDKLKRSQEVRFGEGINLQLSTDDLWSLRQQSIGMSRDYAEYVESFVKEAVSWMLNGPSTTWRT